MLLLVLLAAVFLIAVTISLVWRTRWSCQANCVSMSRRFWLCKLSTVQFTIDGIAEPPSLIATLALLLATPRT